MTPSNILTRHEQFSSEFPYINWHFNIYNVVVKINIIIFKHIDSIYQWKSIFYLQFFFISVSCWAAILIGFFVSPLFVKKKTKRLVGYYVTVFNKKKKKRCMQWVLKFFTSNYKNSNKFNIYLLENYDVIRWLLYNLVPV